MKVLAVNGSARTKGNTYHMLSKVLEPLAAAGAECEIVELGGQDINGCTACRACHAKKDGQCHGRNDYINTLLEKVWDADVIVLGSPTYFADCSPEIKCFIDRVGYVDGANGGLLRRKIGASVVAARRGGAIHAFDSMNHLFGIREMITVGSSYWNDGYGAEKGAVLNDAEAMRTMERLGENIAWVAKRLLDK